MPNNSIIKSINRNHIIIIVIIFTLQLIPEVFAFFHCYLPFLNDTSIFVLVPSCNGSDTIAFVHVSFRALYEALRETDLFPYALKVLSGPRTVDLEIGLQGDTLHLRFELVL